MNKNARKDTDIVDDESDDEEDGGLSVELDDDSEFEIEIVDDVPEDEKPKRPEAKAADESDEDDLEGYSEKVQKRIKKLTFERHEEERQRKEAARLRDEAVRYAQSLYNENQKLQQSLQQNQGTLVEQAKGRLTAEMERAKVAYRTAYDAGDADALMEAQSKLMETQTQLSQLSNYRPAQQQPQQPQRQQQPQYQQPAQQQQPQRPKLTPRQERWMEENRWYGDNSEMTGYALGVHERLVKSGVDPDSQTYYSEIDAAMRRRFADEFSEEEAPVKPTPRKAQNVVAPAARTQKSPRRIKLTASQAAIAKRLGLTPKQYAEQLVKEQNNG